MDLFTRGGDGVTEAAAAEIVDVVDDDDDEDGVSLRGILFSPVIGAPIPSISPGNYPIQQSPYLFAMTLPASCFRHGSRGFCSELVDHSKANGVHSMSRIFDILRLISYAAYSKKINYNLEDEEEAEAAAAAAVAVAEAAAAATLNNRQTDLLLAPLGENGYDTDDSDLRDARVTIDDDDDDDDDDDEIRPVAAAATATTTTTTRRRRPQRLAQAAAAEDADTTTQKKKAAADEGKQGYTFADGTPRLRVYLEILHTANRESFAGVRLWILSVHWKFDLGSLCREALNKSSKAYDPIAQTMKPPSGAGAWCDFTLEDLAHVFHSYLRMCRIDGEVYSEIANHFQPDVYNSGTHICRVFSVENAFDIDVPDLCEEQGALGNYFTDDGTFTGYPLPSNVSLVSLAHVVNNGFDTVPLWCADTRRQEERSLERNRRAFRAAFWNDANKMRRGMSEEMCALITNNDDHLQSEEQRRMVAHVRQLVVELSINANATMEEAVKDTQYTQKRRPFIGRSDNIRLHVIYTRLRKLIISVDLARVYGAEAEKVRALLRFQAQLWGLEKFWNIMVNGIVPGPLKVVRREFVNLPPTEQLRGLSVPFKCSDLTDYGNLKHNFYQWYEILGVHTAHNVAFLLHGAMACAGSPDFNDMLPHIELTGDPGAGKSKVSQIVADLAPQANTTTEMTAKSLSISGDSETGQVLYFPEAPKELRGSKKDIDNQSATLLSMMTEGAVNVKAYNIDSAYGERGNINHTAMMRSMVVVCNNKPTEKGTAVHDRLQQIHMARRNREFCGLDNKATPPGIPLPLARARISSLIYRINSINILFWLAEQSVLPACERSSIDVFVDRLKQELSQEIGGDYVANDRAVMCMSMIAIAYQRLLAQSQEIGSESGRARWRETEDGELRGFNYLSLYYASQRCAVRSEILCDVFTMVCDKFLPTDIEKIATVVMSGFDSEQVTFGGNTTDFGARLWSDLLAGRGDGVVASSHDNSYLAFPAKGVCKLINESLTMRDNALGESNIFSILRDAQSRTVYSHPYNLVDGKRLVKDTSRPKECMSLIQKKSLCVNERSNRQTWYYLMHVDILQYCGIPLAKRIVKRVFEYPSLGRPRIQPLSFPYTTRIGDKMKHLYQFFDVMCIRPDPEKSNPRFNNPLPIGTSTKLAIGDILRDLVSEGSLGDDPQREATLRHQNFLVNMDVDVFSVIIMLLKLGLTLDFSQVVDLAFGFSSGETQSAINAAEKMIAHSGAGAEPAPTMDIEGDPLRINDGGDPSLVVYMKSVQEEVSKFREMHEARQRQRNRRRARPEAEDGGGERATQRQRVGAKMEDHLHVISGCLPTTTSTSDMSSILTKIRNGLTELR